MRIDSDNQHTRKTMRLGRVVEGRQFEVVWSSVKPIRPEPYPRPALWPLGINPCRALQGVEWAMDRI